MSELVLPRTVRGLLDVQTIARPDAVYALALDIGDGGEQAQSGIQFAAMAQYCAQVATLLIGQVCSRATRCHWSCPMV